MNNAVIASIHVASNFAICIAIVMLIPASVGLYYGDMEWQGFVASSLLTGFLAIAAYLATRGQQTPSNARFGFMLVNITWLTTAAAGSLPFLLSPSLEFSVGDAVFESVSAITTTGATVIVGLDHLPSALLLWRSLLQWMGGLGVIALGLFLLPFLRVGVTTYFKLESSDIEDRPFERFATYSISLIGIYVALTLACAICYASAGMTGFNAINHALTTISTAGMSTHDASFGLYASMPAILWISTIFMLVGGLPFSILILFALRGRFHALSDPQIRVFLSYCAVFAVTVAVYLRVTLDMPFLDALTHSAFNFVSVITTTGYSSMNYSLWGPFAVACFFVAMFLGGCSGSTAGGIKAYRFLVLFELTSNGLRRLIHPNIVLPVRYGERTIDPQMQRGVVLFIVAFFMIWVVATLLLAATGLELITAMTGALTALTNVGPGLGDTIGPAGNFSSVPEVAKWILSATMLLGRLEILVVLVLFMPTFWSR